MTGETVFTRSALPVPDRILAPLVVLAGALIGWARIPWAARKVVWAEDGTLFLSNVEWFGFWSTLFTPYTGYLQFWPRVITEIALRTGDLRLFADRISFAACLAAGLIGGGVFIWSRAVVPSRWVRVALAVLPVLVPMGPNEVLGNVANLHWFLIWGTSWMLMWRPRSRSGAIGLAVLAATFALTEPQVAVLLPLFLVDIRARRAWIVRAGALVGLAAQLISELVAPRASAVGHLDVPSIVAGYLVNGPLAALVGDPGTAGGLLARFGWAPAAIALLLFVACFAYVLARGDRSSRAMASMLMYISVATWFLAVWVNVSRALSPAYDYSQFSPDRFRTMTYFRYGFVPGLCLLGIAVLACAILVRRATEVPDLRPSRGRGTGLSRSMHAIPAVALPTALVSALLISFAPASTLRDGAPTWADSVDHARAVCTDPAALTATLGQAPMGWSLDLRCSVLR